MIRDGQALLTEMESHPAGDHAQERISDMQASLGIAKQAKAKIQDKLDRLLAFDASSPRIFEGLDELAASLKAMSQITQAAWNPQTKTFASVDLRGLDLMNSSQFQEITKNAVFVVMYDVKRPEGMSDADFQESVSTLRTQVRTLESDGWTKKAIKDGYIDTVNAAYDPNKEMSIATQLRQYLNDARTFGSELFQKMWGIDYQTAKENKDSKAAEKLLGIAMKYTGMPEELDGSAEQTQAILDKMSDSLAPDDDFWDDFAGTVQVAYPGDSMSSEDGNTALKKKVHQFRYVISQQQVQYIRDWAIKEYGADQAERMTDRDKLVAYAADSDVKVSSSEESARLHNKARYNEDTDKMEYPDGNSDQMNYKVLIGSGGHSEFILDENGNFVSELETGDRTDNDVINGSSFNYANSGNDAQHAHLDRDTVRPLDPQFRKNVSKGYEKPNLSDNPDETYKSGEKAKDHDERVDKHDQRNGNSKYADSWKNKNGRFAQDGKSVKEATQGAGKAFEEDVKEAKS